MGQTLLTATGDVPYGIVLGWLAASVGMSARTRWRGFLFGSVMLLAGALPAYLAASTITYAVGFTGGAAALSFLRAILSDRRRSARGSPTAFHPEARPPLRRDHDGRA